MPRWVPEGDGSLARGSAERHCLYSCRGHSSRTGIPACMAQVIAVWRRVCLVTSSRFALSWRRAHALLMLATPRPRYSTTHPPPWSRSQRLRWARRRAGSRVVGALFLVWRVPAAFRYKSPCCRSMWPPTACASNLSPRMSEGRVPVYRPTRMKGMRCRVRSLHRAARSKRAASSRVSQRSRGAGFGGIQVRGRSDPAGRTKLIAAIRHPSSRRMVPGAQSRSPAYCLQSSGVISPTGRSPHHRSRAEIA